MHGSGYSNGTSVPTLNCTGIKTHGPGSVPDIRRIGWLMCRQIIRHSFLLVVRDTEVIAETSTAEDDLLAGTLGVCHFCARVDLCCTH